MTQIEQIKAEIERRMKKWDNLDKELLSKNSEFGREAPINRWCELKDLLSFIESLPVEEPKWDDKDMRYDETELLSRFAFYTYKDEPEILYLSNVFVEETFRNIGIGTKILKAAERVAETIGAISIRLKVKQDSPANAWYRKRGYGYMTFEGDYDWLEKNLEYMKPNNLSVEEPKVDLEKEIMNILSNVTPITSGENKGKYIISSIGVRAIARHFYDLGCRHAAAMYDDIEFERQRRQKNEPTIKGWVARDIHGTLRLYGNDAADGMGIRTGELPSPYKELTAADDPIEVELVIRAL